MGKSHDTSTLQFYATEAAAYGVRSDNHGPSGRIAAFAAQLPAGAHVLDLGCGTGRDTQGLIDAGFDVTAIDGSAEMAREAERRTGRPVRVLLFEALDYAAAFDGIWANSSLLHVPRAGFDDVLGRVYRALKPGGVLFASFKTGGVEGRDKLGRYYNYLNTDELLARLHAAGAWDGVDVREGRGSGYDGTETDWVEIFARKSSDGGVGAAALDCQSRVRRTSGDAIEDRGGGYFSFCDCLCGLDSRKGR